MGADPETFKKNLHTDHRMKKVFNSAYPLSHLFTNLILLLSIPVFDIEESQCMLKHSTDWHYSNITNNAIQSWHCRLHNKLRNHCKIEVLKRNWVFWTRFFCSRSNVCKWWCVTLAEWMFRVTGPIKRSNMLSPISNCANRVSTYTLHIQRPNKNFIIEMNVFIYN